MKKMGKLDKKPQITEAINRFIAEVSGDFMAMSKKSIEVWQTLENMRPMEKIEKGLAYMGAEDTLFLEDAAIKVVFNRRKSPASLRKLKREIQQILQENP